MHIILTNYTEFIRKKREKKRKRDRDSETETKQHKNFSNMFIIFDRNS